MATILDPKTGDAWEIEGGVWKKVRSGNMLTRTVRPLSLLNGGIPKSCAHPDCGAGFDGAAFKGARTGKLYCSRACRAEMSDEASPEDLARKVN